MKNPTRKHISYGVMRNEMRHETADQRYLRKDSPEVVKMRFALKLQVAKANVAKTSVRLVAEKAASEMIEVGHHTWVDWSGVWHAQIQYDLAVRQLERLLEKEKHHES